MLEGQGHLALPNLFGIRCCPVKEMVFSPTYQNLVPSTICSDINLKLDENGLRN